MPLNSSHFINYAVPPSPPLNVRIVHSTDSTITVSWDAPQFDGGRGGLMYGLYYQLECDSCPRFKYGVVNETVTMGVITGMMILSDIIILYSCSNT